MDALTDGGMNERTVLARRAATNRARNFAEIREEKKSIRPLWRRMCVTSVARAAREHNEVKSMRVHGLIHPIFHIR